MLSMATAHEMEVVTSALVTGAYPGQGGSLATVVDPRGPDAGRCHGHGSAGRLGPETWHIRTLLASAAYAFADNPPPYRART
jgi:hypothetical protein